MYSNLEASVDVFYDTCLNGSTSNTGSNSLEISVCHLGDLNSIIVK